MAKKKKVAKIEEHWRDLLFIGEIEEIVHIRRHLINAKIYEGEEEGLTHAHNAAERMLALIECLATYLARLEGTIPEEARNNRAKRLFRYIGAIRDDPDGK